MEYTLFLILSPIAGAMLLLACVALWKYRSESTGQSLLWYFLLVFLFLLTNIFELLAKTDQWTLTWASLQYPALAWLPLNWLWFSFAYARIKVPNAVLFLFAISVIPVTTTFLAFTMPMHELIYSAVDFEVFDGFSTVAPEYGLWFWVNGVNLYVLIIFGTLVIIRYLLANIRKGYAQSGFILLGAMLPLLVNALYLLPLPLFVHKDYTSLAYALSGLFFFWGIYWKKMLQVVPLARKQVIDEIETIIVILDNDKRLLDLNHAAERFLSLSETDLGTHFSKLTNLNSLMRDPELEETGIFEASGTINNQNRYFDIQISHIRLQASLRHGYLLSINDVTERMNLFNERMKLLVQMEKANADLKEAQLQLIHREKLASIGQISAGVAHELRNPISFISSNFRMISHLLGSLQGTNEELSDSTEIRSIKELLAESQTGIERILSVVNNLLNFSRPARKEEKSSYDLIEGIESTLRILRGSIAPDIILFKELSPVSLVLCHGQEINQVLLNLLTNALQAIEANIDEQGVIRISTREDDALVYCSVCNNGPPVDSAIQDSIFEPFFTTKDSGEGTGLGLSIARDIIEKRHNGSISMHSDMNETCFTFSIPKSISE